ncbi:MAG: tRNA lysidine(34) synthetase TilS [Verrucomicrobiota bacterium]
MLNAIRRTLRDRKLIEPGRHLLVGVSGGADSIAMAHALLELRGELDLHLTLIHLNHRLRGEASDADEAFVRGFGAKHGLEVLTASRDVARSAARKKISLEMAAREARHRWFKQALGRTGADTVALAHTRDDQAETVLLRLIRGAGLDGLAGMEARTTVNGLPMIRPLIDVSRKTLLGYLKRHKLAWREDASNRDTRFVRNRIRHEVIPMLEEQINPRLRETLARTADTLRAEGEWARQFTASFLDTIPAGRRLSGERLAEWPPAARHRVIQAWLLREGLPPEGLTHDLILKLGRWCENPRGSKTLNLPHGLTLFCRYGDLTLGPTEESATALPRMILNRPGKTPAEAWGLMISVDRATGAVRQKGAQIGHWPATASLSADRIGRARLILRAREPGDRYVPLGLRGSKKIQDILVDRKVPRALRDRVPLIECRGEIIWIPGYQVARGWEVPEEQSPSFCLKIEQISS